MDSDRFLRRRASCEGCEQPELDLGLVGMHIAQKTAQYPDWVWATFEHDDNLSATDGVAAPSFHDTTCGGDCCANTGHRVPETGECKTQIKRVESIEPEVATLNGDLRQWLGEQGSVLQHYELVGVQYVPLTATTDRKPTHPRTCETR